MAPRTKRTKRAKTGGCNVGSQLVAEPALLEAIVSFLPVPRSRTRAAGEWFARGVPSTELTGHLHALAAVCRAFPALAQRVGPKNEAFWRTAVLTHFDFQADDDSLFNVYEEDGMVGQRCQWYFPRAEGEYTGGEGEDEDAGLTWRRRVGDAEAVCAAIAAWDAENPDLGLVTPLLRNSLVWWPHLGAYFRPHEYGFLEQIQRGEADASAWPPHKDAFSLYCDLALLVDRIRKFDTVTTWSAGIEEVFPCLLGKFDGPVEGKEHELFQHCEIIPYGWDGYIDRWDGIDGPPPEPYVEGSVEEDEEEEEENGELKEINSVFPVENYASDPSFKRLRSLVHEVFSDWRAVYTNRDNKPGPHFYIGRSKRSTRWLGFVGESNYYHY